MMWRQPQQINPSTNQLEIKNPGDAGVFQITSLVQLS